MKKTVRKISYLFLILLSVCLFSACSLPKIEIPGGGGESDGKVTVRVLHYVQDAETGDYVESVKSSQEMAKGSSFVYTPETVQYHLFNADQSLVSVTDVQSDTDLKAYYDCETCTVTYSGGGGTLVSGTETQTLRKGQAPSFPTYRREGYTFLGFGVQPSAVYEDCTFVAEWGQASYTLTLHLPLGAVISDPAYQLHSQSGGATYVRSFTAESEFSLPVPQYDGGTFLGWKYNVNDSETVTAVSRGTTKSVTLYGSFAQPLVFLNFSGSDIPNIDPYYLPAGTEITAPQVPPEEQRVGYGLNWYTTSSYTALYDFSEMPSVATTVYGKWEKDTGTSFIGWDVETEEIDSYEELITFIEYVVFFDVRTPVSIPCNYGTYDTIESKVQQAYQEISFRAGGSISFAAVGRAGDFSLSLSSTGNTRATDATLTTEPNSMSPYSFVGYETQGRGSTYNEFYIDSLPETVQVETSNQLLYVVERGAKPLCKAGSKAETVYNAARAVLREIVADSYTDYEKAEAIYEYLVLKVQYDYEQVETVLPNDWTYYDAYYLEGVFLHRKAVCDGISKAFALLCGIEGIPCVQITGVQYSGDAMVAGSGHAWCKVKINNRWYLADPTFGNLRVSGTDRSVLSHEFFLTDAASKTDGGYLADNFDNIPCEEDYGYFDRKTVTVSGVEIDFVIDSVQEFSYLLEYCKAAEANLSGHSVDFIYNISAPQYQNNFLSAYEAAKVALRGRGVTYNYSISRMGEGFGSVITLIFN